MDDGSMDEMYGCNSFLGCFNCPLLSYLLHRLDYLSIYLSIDQSFVWASMCNTVHVYVCSE